MAREIPHRNADAGPSRSRSRPARHIISDDEEEGEEEDRPRAPRRAAASDGGGGSENGSEDAGGYGDDGDSDSDDGDGDGDGDGGRRRGSGTQRNGSGHGAEPSGQKRKRHPQTLASVFETPDIGKKRQVGMEYRALQMEADDNSANVSNLTFKDVQRSLLKQNKLFANVKDTDNGGLDARLILAHTEMTNSIARKLRVDTSAFDVDGFISKTATLLGIGRINMDDDDEDDDDEEEDDQDASDIDELDDGGDALPRRKRARRGAFGGALGDWEKIGWMAARWMRRVPGIDFMHGPLAVEYKKRTQTQRQRRTQLAPELKPTEIVRAEGRAEKVDTQGHVHKVGRLLARSDPQSRGLNFFRFVINPFSFGQTVENIFFVSFLIREGRAGVHVEEDGTVMITARQPPSADDPSQAEAHGDDEGQAEVTNGQGVMEFDMDTWDAAIKLWDITQPMIPHREPEDRPPMGGNQWYS